MAEEYGWEDVTDDGSEYIGDLWYDLETRLLEDIAFRIKSNDLSMVDTAQYEVMKLRELGLQQEYINYEIAKLLNISIAEVEKIMTDSAYAKMRADLERASSVGVYVAGQSINMSGIRQQVMVGQSVLNNELNNLTRTTANIASRELMRYFDQAYLDVSSGAFSMDQAVDRAIKELAKNGLGMVDYPSGTHRRLDTAVRTAVRTATTQNNLAIEENLLDQLDVNLVVVSSHLGARPSHAEWQGKVYWRKHPEGNYENFYEATGYGTGPGLGGWNCRHQFFMYDPDMGNPFDEYDSEENRKAYDLTQQQRYNERMIREWKRREQVYKKAGLDITKERMKVREWTKRNNDLLKHSNGFLKRAYGREKAYFEEEK
ncbi:MAG: hypothetical protein J6D36_01745 [Erysipelotrichaceae bacterium]|nr:hypothetical protein [Erysipelotrichaceae bacterium]